MEKGNLKSKICPYDFREDNQAKINLLTILGKALQALWRNTLASFPYIGSSAKDMGQKAWSRFEYTTPTLCQSRPITSGRTENIKKILSILEKGREGQSCQPHTGQLHRAIYMEEGSTANTRLQTKLWSLLCASWTKLNPL